MLPRSGVYAIRHKASYKVYVGSAAFLKRRLNEHRYQLRAGVHPNARLQNAWIKYGERAFEFIELEVVRDRTQLVAREQHWIDTYKSWDDTYGYNLRPKADSNLGMTWGEVVKEKHRATWRRRKEQAAAEGRPLYDPETIALRAASLKKAWAAKAPEERAAWGDAIQEAKKGINTEAMKAAQKALIGTKRSAETREKLRQSHLGRQPTAEHRAALGAARKAAWARGTRERFDIDEALAAEAEKRGRALTEAEADRVNVRERMRRHRARKPEVAAEEREARRLAGIAKSAEGRRKYDFTAALEAEAAAFGRELTPPERLRVANREKMRRHRARAAAR